jgi:isopenicillin-N N-acyltransferase-like protein
VSALPLLDLAGGPAERGRAHGEALAGAIADNVETYLARFEAGGVARADALAEGARWGARIERFNAGYAAEMRAIADGAGIDPAAVAMLNARWEMSYTLFAREAAAGDGCTAFAALPEITRTGTTLIGQNWDWLQRLCGRLAVLRVTGGEHPDFLCITQAGIAGGMIGLNAAGIGLCVNGMTSDQDGRDAERKPFHVRVRELLCASSLATALKAFLGTPRACSMNVLVGHAGGEAIDLELAPDSESTLHPEDGLLTHANHFERPPGVASTLQWLRPSTLYRARRLNRLIRQANRPVDVELAQSLFTDHFSRPHSICAHPDPDVAEVERSTTVTSAILDLANRVLYATDGPPCENPYTPYALDT